MYDITPIIEAVAALIGVIVTCVLIPFIKSKTTASQQAEINAWVKIAVSAAEQIFKGSGRGEEKKQYVIAWLKERGVTVNENELDALIEAAVYELTQASSLWRASPLRPLPKSARTRRKSNHE